ncbi:VTT domain-containing protein [Maricaulis sp.]|uniref:VTT domain-containing protein n=1 Tax=Maricaulis sp. TaxID=1486257 RepID=UPI0025B7D2E2|nr:VTT domain-containing protein [Maricaulis sp.]
MSGPHHWLVWFERNKAWIVWSALILVAIIGIARGDFISGQLLDGWASSTPDAALLFGVFAWFFASQLVVLPSGTLSVLVAGALFGWPAGLLYFFAMLLAGQLLHLLARQDRGAARRALEKALGNKLGQGLLARLIERAERRAVTTTIMLRLLPIAPSAICPLVLGTIGGEAWKLAIGTLISGWVRPLSLAIVGQSASQVLLEPEPILAEVAQPVVLVALMSIALSTLAGFLISRPLREH